MKIELSVPQLKSRGDYALSGKVFNIEGLDSDGPYRFVLFLVKLNFGLNLKIKFRNVYSGITAHGEGNIVNMGDHIEIGEMKIRLRISEIK